MFAKKSTFSDLNETWYDVRGRWHIHDDMTFKVIRGQGQGQEMTSSPFGTILFLHVAYRWQSCDIICTSGFVDDVSFSHNGPMARHMYS